MFCTECGTKNPSDAKFCSVCGYSFPSIQEERKPSLRQPPNMPHQEIKYCRECGKQLTPNKNVWNKNVCGDCGAPIGTGNIFCPCCGDVTKPGDITCSTCNASFNLPIYRNPANNLPNPAINPSSNALKKRKEAGWQGILLGCFGAHNFYLGYKQKGIVQLCIGVFGILTSFFGIGIVALFGVSIWGLIEGIQILTGSINEDADGNPLID